MGKKGQFGTYLKPIIVVIFGILFIFVINIVLQNQQQLEEGERETKIFQKARADFQKLADCLKVENSYSGSRFLLNATKLEKFEEKYVSREPPCAEDFEYGYYVTVSPTCLQDIGVSKDVQFCNKDFQFGETGSTGNSLRESVIRVFHASIRFEDDVKTSTTVGISIKSGDLETIVGAANRLVATIDNSNTTQATLEYVNEQPVCAGDGCSQPDPQSICLEATEETRCSRIRAENIESFRIDPGSHFLSLKYNQEDRKLVIDN